MNERIAEVAERLRSGEVSFALIGAAAMSARGFPRQTLDFDFFTTDRFVLERGFWEEVDSRVGELPPAARRLWEELRASE